MTKIAYIRAMHQASYQASSPVKGVAPVVSLSFQPPMPHQPVTSFPPPQHSRPGPLPSAPKPLIMTPTTRFNTNPSVLLGEQGGRISKPLMEKRRRARINQCLSKLKTIVVDSAGQYTQNNKCKLEKADILELTVNYVKQLHHQREECGTHQSYVAGYSDCVRQVLEFITDVPELGDTAKQSLSGHLTQNLATVQQQHQASFTTPPSPAPSSESNQSSASCSPTEGFHRNETRHASPIDFEDLDEEDLDDEEAFEVEMAHRPLNLKVNREPGVESDDMWRPW